MKTRVNYTILFIMLFNSSIVAGLGLRDTINHSMIYATGVGMIFLIGAVFSSIKEAKRKEEVQRPRIN
ncbi:hypothetical protein [Priestia endophytica]|uniref:hypothetical protein n=1 Tax=Priestia endophytica TaxID=135735 RepID=UPI00124CDE0D|nr:hypothetical protein [Priestia endophytica]KAB2489656.1 hypothetical protein F8155_23285 [Priestia endophytica]